jgi:hypothetical protein
MAAERWLRSVASERYNCSEPSLSSEIHSIICTASQARRIGMKIDKKGGSTPSHRWGRSAASPIQVLCSLTVCFTGEKIYLSSQDY